jgi:hypothetical protein
MFFSFELSNKIRIIEIKTIGMILINVANLSQDIAELFFFFKMIPEIKLPEILRDCPTIPVQKPSQITM